MNTNKLNNNIFVPLRRSSRGAPQAEGMRPQRLELKQMLAGAYAKVLYVCIYIYIYICRPNDHAISHSTRTKTNNSKPLEG